MGVVIALMGMIGISVLVAFFSFQPSFAKPEQLRVFNWSVLAAVFMVAGAWLLNAEALFSTMAYQKYKTFIMLTGFFAIESVGLLVFLLVRNFWVFKGKQNWGRR